MTIPDFARAHLTRRSLLALGLGATLSRLWSRAEPVWACEQPPAWPPPFGFPDLDYSAPPTISSGPTRVAVNGGNYQYAYTVNGQPDVIRGIGYNPQSSGLSFVERRRRLERDFSLMSAASVNTIVGWDPVEFDGLTLDVAAQHGLGIALPYDVDLLADFRDGTARATAMGQALALVHRYRSHPALRMWAIGNEAFQRTVPPIWCATPATADQASRAQVVAGLLVELADVVHANDPDHPVLYREAEEAYVHWLADAFRQQPAARPWFIYGVNAYTPRLAEILNAWPAKGLDAALLVPEYALYDAQPGARVQGFRDLWAMIRSQPGYVLGGAIYVWYTQGPEEVDLRYGLVDIDGRPVDDALEAIGQIYHADAINRP